MTTADHSKTEDQKKTQSRIYRSVRSLHTYRFPVSAINPNQISRFRPLYKLTSWLL